ncbi:hypothetical protein [Sciscionella marina]|uniref:hypothetical protein n=1 Tax=Sciscionella marina TaxID=508770 RepID=UPI0003A164D9|nr:hypothetical protein [Sciscionella marina]
MSWDDFYRRRDAVNTVLATAARRGNGALPYDELPAVREVFGTREELLTTLQYKWQQTLTGQIDVAIAEADDDPRIDRFDVVRDAWLAATKREPVLRAVLDANEHHPAISGRIANERRKLAHLAGLTSAGDSEEEATHLGGTFLALVRAGNDKAGNSPRRGTALLRKLADAVSA